MVTLMSTGCLFLIRQLRETKEKGRKQEKKDEKVDEFIHLDFSRLKTAYSEALEDFMLHRNTHLHPLLFQDLINRHPRVGWCLAEDLVTYIGKGINNFRKIQACTMLSQLLNRKFHCQNKDIETISKPLQEAFYSTFAQLSSSEANMKAKHLRQILKLASQFIKILKADCRLLSLLDSKRFGESLDIAFGSQTVERASDLKNLISRLKADITGTASVGNEDRKSKKKRRRKLSATSNEISKDQLQNGGNTDASEKIAPKKKKKKSKEKS